jgi:hypothetical protein
MHRDPREGGGPCLVWNTMDSRFRGNDVATGSAVLRQAPRPKPQTLNSEFDSSLGQRARRCYEPTTSSTGTPARAGKTSEEGWETGKSACPTSGKFNERTENVDENREQLAAVASQRGVQATTEQLA